MDKNTQPIEEVKGRPMLHWYGKKPLQSIEYFPAQEKEVYGNPDSIEFNKLFWGDNLQVLSHLLKEYRGKVDLIYIDPPFDSKADYIKKVKIRGEQIDGLQQSLLEEKQYTDIWANDEYLQFMYERLQIMKELMNDSASIFVHCDYRRNSHLRLMLDEIFGENVFRNEIIWKRKGGSSNPTGQFDVATDTLLWYSNSEKIKFYPQYNKDTPETLDYIEERFDNTDEKGRRFMKSPIVSPNYRENLAYPYKGYTPPHNGWSISKDLMEKWDREGKLYFPKNGDRIYRKIYLDEYLGQPLSNLWDDIYVINPMAGERLSYPTQKPESLLERVINTCTEVNNLVFDCFCGSGTTLAVAEKLGRRWLGCDINLGAIQTTTKRLNQIIHEQSKQLNPKEISAFKVLNVNEYDMFKNEIEAKEIIMDMYGIEPIKRSYFDGTLDNKYVKVMPLNRVLNKLDIAEVIKNVAKNVDTFTAKKMSKANEETYEESILVVGSGIESDVIDYIRKENKTHVKIEVRDIQSDKKSLIFKQPPEAQIEVAVDKNKLQVHLIDFHSPILIQKIKLENEKRLKEDSEARVEDFKQIIDSVSIDVNYDGKLFNAEIMDLPDKKSMITGQYAYDYPAKGKYSVAIKIIDVLGEEYFETFSVEVKGS